MKLLTTLLDIVTAFLHVLEAEGRILKRAVMNGRYLFRAFTSGRISILRKKISAPSD